MAVSSIMSAQTFPGGVGLLNARKDAGLFVFKAVTVATAASIYKGHAHAQCHVIEVAGNVCSAASRLCVWSAKLGNSFDEAACRTALLHRLEVVLIAMASSVDEGLAAEGAAVKEVPWEGGTAVSRLRRQSACHPLVVQAG